MGIHLCLQTLAGHSQRSMYSSINPHFKALPKGSGENSPVQVLRMVLGWPRAGLAGCWECCGRCLWAEDKAPFCWRSSQVLSPLWAQSFSLQSSSPAVPAVLKGAVTAFSFSSGAVAHGSPLWCPRASALPGHPDKAWGQPTLLQGQSSCLPRAALPGNVSQSGFILCSVKWELGQHTGPLLLQFFSSISPPCRAVAALMLFVVRKKGNNSISYSDITFSASLKACMCLNMLPRAEF